MCTDTADNIYVAGEFTETGRMLKSYVAKWDKVVHEWYELGVGSNSLNTYGPIFTITADKFGNVYAAGDFTYDSFIVSSVPYFVARWNGTNWSPLGLGANALNANGDIHAICVDDSGHLYAAGNFRNSSSNYYVAKWNGSSWSDLGGLNANLFINSICVDDSFNVYAAGNFTDGSGHTYVAEYKPGTGIWYELGSGFDSGSFELVIPSIFTDTPNHVYVALNSTHCNCSNVFKWNGIEWHQLAALNGNNTTQTICGGDSGIVYAAGRFTDNSGHTYIAKYDAQSDLWSELGTGTNALDPQPLVMVIARQ